MELAVGVCPTTVAEDFSEKRRPLMLVNSNHKCNKFGDEGLS
jgi:hypothetical protein